MICEVKWYWDGEPSAFTADLTIDQQAEIAARLQAKAAAGEVEEPSVSTLEVLSYDDLKSTLDDWLEEW